MLRAIDLGLLRLLRTRGHAPPVERAVAAFSRVGEHGALWFAIAGAGSALDGSRRDVYRRAARTVALTMVCNYSAKLAIRRARPSLEGLPALLPVTSQLSYPSAHAATSFAGARVLSAALPAAPLYVVATCMGLSRPYLGIHYPSDVVAGAVLGRALAELAP